MCSSTCIQSASCDCGELERGREGLDLEWLDHPEGEAADGSGTVGLADLRR